MTAIVIGKTQSVSEVAKKEVVPPSDQKTQEANRLQKEASVRVRRSSGVFESGWVIDKFDRSIIISSSSLIFLWGARGASPRLCGGRSLW